MRRWILFAIADDSASLEAVPVVASYARALDAAVRVLHIDGSGPAPEEIEGCPSLLEYVLERLAAAKVDAEGETWPAGAREPVADVVARVAERAGASLVAVGHRGPSDLGGAILAARHAADAALLVVRTTQRISPLPRRILVALDGSPTPAAALDGAAELATRAGAELIVVHATTGDGGDQIVGQAVEELAARGVAAIGEVVPCPWGPPEAIDSAARRHHADLVVLAPRRRGPGGLAHRLVHRLVRPVLLARPAPT